MEKLPRHLQKYIVEQNYEKYTSVDHACWRFILRQLKNYLSQHAHESYLEGLEKTGIEIEYIPKISDISAKLEKFGWRAIPVSGFIPPAAFMELQSLGILPIASDMRSLDHLMYTPAPDIVHEAAGHAPILIHPEFAAYLKRYAQVAKKAIISREDLALYEAIRHLSDIKENPNSTPEEIAKAQENLEKTSRGITHVSEASELSRMNWWTAEYGLIGALDNPRIYGAGLLSSVGESKLCLSDKVKKIPFSLDCIKTGYDITEPQPQLFVTPDFKTLIRVLDEMSETMAYKTGGIAGLKKAVQAESVNTVELNSGLQISGICEKYLAKNGSVYFIKFKGPCQLSLSDQELDGHGVKYHKEGFSSPLGDWKNSQLVEGQWSEIQFESGISLKGLLKKVLTKNGQRVLLTFENCTVLSPEKEILFDPSWGTFDLAVGNSVTSVFGGPADRVKYGEVEDFVAARVPQPKWSEKEKRRQALYLQIRQLRENGSKGLELENSLKQLISSIEKEFPQDWLLYLESLELLVNRAPQSPLANEYRARLDSLQKDVPALQFSIKDGLALINKWVH